LPGLRPALSSPPAFVPSLTPLVRLVQGDLRVEVSPEIGGAIAAFWSLDSAGRRTDWLRPATADALARRDILAMGSFPLVPFCNRLRQGRARFEGREIRMAPNHPCVPSPHPLHGIGWQRPWTLLARTDASCELGLYVPASEAWPWRFSAMQRIELRDGALQVRLSVLNEDTQAMPAGLGHHPYFPRGAGVRLTCATAAMWRTDTEVMPVALETGGIVDRLRTGLSVAEADLDNNFVGWDRQARIDWLATEGEPARSLRLEADPVLDRFVVYAPPGVDHFCAEPVSQCTDWLNLLDRYGRGPLGGARLEAGEPLAVSFRLVPG
jgi:aldose 1-epimerase